MAKDYRRIHRLMQLILLMQQQDAATAGALARRLGVTERTIFRDLQILTDLGIPHMYDAEAGGYRIRRDFFLPPLHLSASESLALIALGQGLGQSQQIAMTSPAVTAIEKIRSILPPRVLDELGDIHQHLDIQLAATGPDADAIADSYHHMQQAIATRTALRCEYDALYATSPSEPFHFCPYVLSFDQRAWYAIGHHDGRNEVRRLKLNRFVSLQKTRRRYTIPRDFSLAAFRGQAWRMIRGDKLHTVTIQFDAIMADTVAEVNWVPSQEIQYHADGSITFRCEVEGLSEIVWWVLGYGPHAVVMEPPELVELLAEKAKATASLYAS